jgi:hypothetical protein
MLDVIWKGREESGEGPGQECSRGSFRGSYYDPSLRTPEELMKLAPAERVKAIKANEATTEALTKAPKLQSLTKNQRSSSTKIDICEKCRKEDASARHHRGAYLVSESGKGGSCETIRIP